MKIMKIFISLVLVLSICIALVGCGSQSSVSAMTDQSNSNKTTDPSRENSADTANPGRPETENPTHLSQPDETGRYRHEIDGAVFYTEHSVDEWINGDVFYIDDMIMDIFGSVGEYGRGIAGPPRDSSTPYLVVYEIIDPNGNPQNTPSDTDCPHVWLGTTIVYEYGNYGDLYRIYEWNRYIPYEMLEIILYACEQRVLGNTDALNYLNFQGGHIVIVN